METPEHHSPSLGSGPGAQPGSPAISSARTDEAGALTEAAAHAPEVRGGLVVQQTNWLGASQVRAGNRQPRQWRAGQRRTQQLRG